MIAAPAHDRSRYLKVLSDLAGRLNQATMRDRLLAAPTPTAVMGVLLGHA
jgi:mannitol/fructose-specific phosphotransferase system IIA component (Ntr-type)